METKQPICANSRYHSCYVVLTEDDILLGLKKCKRCRDRSRAKQDARRRLAIKLLEARALAERGSRGQKAVDYLRRSQAHLRQATERWVSRHADQKKLSESHAHEVAAGRAKAPARCPKCKRGKADGTRIVAYGLHWVPRPPLRGRSPWAAVAEAYMCWRCWAAQTKADKLAALKREARR